MKKNIYMISFLTLFLILCSISVFAADNNIKLTAYWMMSKDTSQYQSLEKFAKNVEDRTDGKVEISLYANGVMGNDLESMEAMRMGSIDIRLAGNGIYANYCKPISLMVLPFLFEGKDHLLKFVNSSLWDDLTKGLIDSNIKPLANWHGGFRGLNTKTPVKSVEDVKDLKIRLPAISPWVKVWKEFGALPVAMAYSELYVSLKTGVIDAQDNPPVMTKSGKFYEVAKYYTPIQYAWLGPILSMNLDKWNSLPGDIKEIFKEEAHNIGNESFENGINMNNERLKLMEENDGLEVIWNFDRESFVKRANNVYTKFEEESWYDQEMVKKIKALAK